MNHCHEPSEVASPGRDDFHIIPSFPSSSSSWFNRGSKSAHGLTSDPFRCDRSRQENPVNPVNPVKIPSEMAHRIVMHSAIRQNLPTKIPYL
jgi:hypothetical protein